MRHATSCIGDSRSSDRSQMSVGRHTLKAKSVSLGSRHRLLTEVLIECNLDWTRQMRTTQHSRSESTTAQNLGGLLILAACC